jgi:glutathione S-transferase
MSLADVMLAPQLDYIAMTPEGSAILAGTALEAWLGRMRKRPSMIATQPPGALRAAA